MEGGIGTYLEVLKNLEGSKSKTLHLFENVYRIVLMGGQQFFYQKMDGRF